MLATNIKQVAIINFRVATYFLGVAINIKQVAIYNFRVATTKLGIQRIKMGEATHKYLLNCRYSAAPKTLDH